MHAADPVAWQTWSAETLQIARDQDKLLFVSSGYFSCHWCHVMQRESYRNAEIANLLNSQFIPVKIDRELQAGLDAFLIDFVERTQGHAGWPLNVFITPQGDLLLGMTYLPPDQFQVLLQNLAARWHEDKPRLLDLAHRVRQEIVDAKRDEHAASETAAPASSAAWRQALRAEALQYADTMSGGFGDQNKFPMAPQLSALVDLQSRQASPDVSHFVQLTLDSMANEGLRDHLAGGFFRYTVDPTWQVPHFEKMLYTQAELAQLYLQAAELFGREDYMQVAIDTLRFVIREMRGSEGGFVSSLSAVDGAGKEGGAYLWNDDELDRVLGADDAELARRFWRLRKTTAVDGLLLPRRGESLDEIASALGVSMNAASERLEGIRQRLLNARSLRDLPVDGKQLAGWNGLLLAALSRAKAHSHDPLLSDAALRLRRFLMERLWDGQSLRRAVDATAVLAEGSLEDYAYVAYGLSSYAKSQTESTDDRQLITKLLDIAWTRFYRDNGWQLDSAPLLPGMPRDVVLSDNALLSPSALIVRLSLESDDLALRGKAMRALNAAESAVWRDPFWHASTLELIAGNKAADASPAERSSSDRPTTAVTNSAVDAIGDQSAREILRSSTR